jgi:hypothetical protein
MEERHVSHTRHFPRLSPRVALPSRISFRNAHIKTHSKPALSYPFLIRASFLSRLQRLISASRR